MLQVTGAGLDVFLDSGKLNVVGQLWKPVFSIIYPMGFLFLMSARSAGLPEYVGARIEHPLPLPLNRDPSNVPILNNIRDTRRQYTRVSSVHVLKRSSGVSDSLMPDQTNRGSQSLQGGFCENACNSFTFNRFRTFAAHI
jgi:hypothetical protein